MRRGSHILTWLVLLTLVGGHWGVLQVIGWTGMLWSYSRELGFTVGVVMTFNGDNECHICRVVDQGVLGDEQNPNTKQTGEQHDVAFTVTVKTMKVDAVIAPLWTGCVGAPMLGVVESWYQFHDDGVLWPPGRRPPRSAA